MAKARLNDVAARAGVSMKTVSRVVNNEPHVRPATRDKVLRAIDALNYKPDVSARRLAGSRSYLLALIYEDPSAYENPSANYVTDIQGGALAAAREANYDVLIHPCNYENPRIADELQTLVGQKRIDGVILVPPLAEMPALAETLRKLEKPFVRISPGQAHGGYDSVHTNDREACEEMTRYLVSLGHRRIGFIIGHPDHKAVANRHKGFVDGMRGCGVRIDAELVQQGYNSFESGMSCARRLLLLKKPPTAIFASNDDMAAGVMRVAYEMGIPVPESLSVAGFDDVPLARLIWPALTTIHQPIKDIAHTAATLLLHRLRNEETDEDITLDGKLVIRESTARPAGH
jgi:LacI family transcriptional regulator